VEDTDSMNSIDGFSGMLLITPDADWKEKWETPPEVVPRLSSADTVKIGEKLTILIFFVNPKIDLENKIDLDCDIRTIRPDGSFTFDLKDYDCGNGELKGNPGNVRLARAVISFEAEPSDEPGDWWIEVKLKDKVADIEIPLKTKFVLLDSESQ
nr:hypothetical protein [Acidiferrobacterales bacterium]